ncbi:MAG: DUF1343 domain-containing protein [Chlamydiota bacterium]
MRVKSYLSRSVLILFLLCLGGGYTADAASHPKIHVGVDNLFEGKNPQIMRKKSIGLITNHTAVNREMKPTLDVLLSNANKYQYTVKAIFAPEHGLFGAAYANEDIGHQVHHNGIPIYSLHGETDRPTEKMLRGIDLLIYDIQDIGARSYTYSTTLFYVMEEAAKRGIDVIVLDRPNPINGLTIDGPMLDERYRSKLGYINVPYCHGMTIGELAQYFNGEYKVGCHLRVVPMKGWKREMSFQETGLAWIPTSPQVPEASTAFFYPTTGIIGELSLMNIGIGYTLPFKVVGAPWIDANLFAQHLNAQKFPGVHFEPFHYRPFYGKFAHEDCHGVLIVISNPKTFKPVTTQYLIMGIVKSLYPEKVQEALEATKSKKDLFHKVNGTKEIYQIISKEPYIVWKLRAFQQKEREEFRKVRSQYLISSYSF